MAYGINNSPFGLRPVGTFNNSPWQTNLATAQIATNYATALYPGDLVAVNIANAATTGYIVQAVAGGTTAVNPGTPNTSIIFGVFQSCTYTLASGTIAQPVQKVKVWPGSNAVNLQPGSTVTANICMGDTVYEVQADTTLATGYSFANIYSTANFIQNAANPVLLESGVTIGAPVTTAIAQLKVLGFSPFQSATNLPGVQFNTVLVMINTPFTATYQCP